MANVYDAVTRAECIRQSHRCDPHSGNLIVQLIRWLDEADAATSQRKYNDLALHYSTAIFERDKLVGIVENLRAYIIASTHPDNPIPRAIVREAERLLAEIRGGANEKRG